MSTRSIKAALGLVFVSAVVTAFALHAQIIQGSGGGGGGAGTGTVTSVSMTAPSWLSVSNVPITASGAISLASATGQTANQFLATPDGTTGALALRSILPADLPIATNSAFGAVRPDGTTVTISGGVLSAAASGGTGTVTSVGMSVPSWLTVTGTPVTTTGTLAVSGTTGLTANQIIATPNGTTGAVGLRSLVPGDLPVATTAALGAVRPDGTTITISGGTISAVAGGSGTVTSVGMTVPSWLSVSGSPVTGNGALAVSMATGQTANQFLASPNGSSGAVGLRAIAAADLPAGTTQTIGSGTAVLGTSAIASGACATAVTVAAAGVATTDAITFTPNADITAVTGYAPVTTGGLSIYPYPTANNVNFRVCNPTSASITPGAVTLNWRVTR